MTGVQTCALPILCWVTTHSVEGTYILKMESIISFYRDTKYAIEIILMGTSYLGPATLVKNY